MMNTLQQGILVLLYSAVSGERKPLPEEFDLEAAMPLIKRHKIGNLIYYGAVHCGLNSKQPIMQELFSITYKCMAVDERQKRELDKLTAAFQSAGVHYLPLKGVMMKALYPKPDMRIMGDADIMIKMEHADKIRDIVEQLGYRYVVDNDHEWVWAHPGLHLELHKRLVPAYNQDFAAYYGDCWRLARPVPGDSCQFEMSDEDHMIFLLTHFAKHYRNGGIGVRHMLDLYVYQKAKPHMDWYYINGELEKLKLDGFCRNINDTLAAWFENGLETRETQLIAQHIFQSGAYGSADGRVMADAIRQKSGSGESSGRVRRRRWVHAIFLPYSSMCSQYPVLKKAAVLLPIMWVVRWLDIILRRPERIQYQRRRLGMIQDDTLNTYEDRMNAVGLAVGFREDE